VLVTGSAERCQHDRAGDPGVGGDRQGIPGVVIDPGQDLGFLPAGQLPVDEVGLPALVGQVGGKPDVGRLRPLGRVGGDQARPGQVPADGRGRHSDLVVVFQVPGNGVRPGVPAMPGQLLPQPRDQLDGARADRGRGGLRPPGPRLERRLALGPVAGQQPADPALGNPVPAGRLALAQPLGNDSSDDKTRLRHARTVAARPFLCLATRHSNVLKLDTAGRAKFA
jgi:hypothetical protein